MILPARYQNLRKSTLFIIFFVLFFVVFQLAGSLREKGKYTETLPEMKTSAPRAKMEICGNIVDGKPFGVDSIFPALRARVFAYTKIAEPVDRKLIWYYEADSVFSDVCDAEEEVCISSLAPEVLQVGLWSVDLMSGNQLLASRQFSVVSGEF